MATVATREELLISGFIHAIEVLLINNLLNVIPDAISLLCYQFYRSYMKLGIAYRGKFPKSINRFGIMDIQSHNIVHYEFNNDPPEISFEYLINNICDKLSKEFLTKNNYQPLTIYDGIFCKYHWHNNDAYQTWTCPCILLLEQNKEENKIIRYNSNKTMPDFRIMMYCDDKSSIYAESDGILYELNLSTIIDYNFEFIQINDGSVFWKDCASSWMNQVYLKLEYIQSTDRLFGIKCHSVPWLRLRSEWNEDTYNQDQEIQCGIYDFDTNQWKEAVPFKYKWKNDEFSCITAYDTRLNVIYMQSNNGYTAKYDCNEDEWEILLWEKIGMLIVKGVEEMGKLWVEGNTLKWAKRMDCGEIIALDLSVSKKDRQWVKESDAIKTDVDKHRISIF